MAPAAPMEMTREEFETLPATVRRKCFSTTERQQFTRPEHHRQSQDRPNHSFLARDLLAASPRPTSGHPQAAAAPTRGRKRGRQAVSATLTSADITTPEFARFYDSLPEKIKRGQFSARERDLLSKRRQGLVFDDIEDRPLQPRRGSLPSLHTDTTGGSSVSSDDLQTLVTTDDMDAELLASFRWIDESEPDLTLDDYHTAVAQVAESKPQVDANQLPFRRNRSYTNFSLRNGGRKSFDQRSGTADGPTARTAAEPWATRFPASSDIPPVPALPEVTTHISAGRPRSPAEPRLSLSQLHAKATQPEPRASASIVRPKMEPAEPRVSTSQIRAKAERWNSTWPSVRDHQRTDSVNAAPAEHYLSPEARLKLRLYLATPSKFDEALEHGFPALPSPQMPRNSTSSRTQGHGGRPRHNAPAMTFLHDGTVQDLQLVEDTKVYRPMVHAISRPGSSCYEPTEVSSPHSTEPTESSLSRDLDKDLEADLTEWPATAREMTLRMTLTRPELRDSDGIAHAQAMPYAARPRYVGIGAKKDLPNELAMPSLMRNPLSLEDLFVEPTSPPKPERTGFRRLFAKRW